MAATPDFATVLREFGRDLRHVTGLAAALSFDLSAAPIDLLSGQPSAIRTFLQSAAQRRSSSRRTATSKPEEY
jgi:hypothetical protein